MTKMSLATLLTLAFLSSCVTSIQSGEFSLEKEDTESSFSAVRARAEFETGCPKDQIELVVLDSSKNFVPAVATQIGATGCGHKNVYVRSRSGWVLDSASRKSESPPATPE